MKKIFSILAMLFVGVGNAYAQVHLDQGALGDGTDPLIKPDQTGTAESALNEFLLNIADSLLYFAGGIAVIGLVVGAFHLVQGRGNEEQLAKAKITILWTLIGLGVVIFSYSLVRTVIYLVFVSVD